LLSAEEIIPGITPTRMQLLELNQRLELARKGHELLSEKLEALTGELFSSVTIYKEKRKKIQISIKESQDYLQLLQLQIGKLSVRNIALNYPRIFSIESSKRSLMGISVPVFQVQKEKKNLESSFYYSIIDTTAQFDSALKLFEESLLNTIELAEIQSTLSRLAKEINETKRRVNALNYIIIPRIEATVNWIELTLAEHERESFVRLKKVKKRISNK
jgi:V/A-type H+-transporting ATPase subunit D